MSITVAATPRTAFGSRKASAARKAGQLPLTLSRSGAESVHLLVGTKDGAELARNLHRLVTVTVEGQAHQVLVQEFQRHPVKDELLSINGLAVRPDQQITVEVPVRPLANNCPGVRAGGIVEVMKRTLKVRCPANAIPVHLDIDLSTTELDTTIYASQVVLPAGVTMATAGKTAVLAVIKARLLKAAETETAAAAATAAEGAAKPAEGEAAKAADGKAPAAAKPGEKAPAAAKPADKKK